MINWEFRRNRLFGNWYYRAENYNYSESIEFSFNSKDVIEKLKDILDPTDNGNKTRNIYNHEDNV